MTQKVRPRWLFKIWIPTLAASLFITGMLACYLIPRDPVKLYREIPNTKLRAKQCNPPLFYLISEKIPPRHRKTIREAFDYWNGIAREYGKKNKRLFFHGGKTELLAESGEPIPIQGIVGVFLVEREEPGPALAITAYHDLENGCIKSADIAIYRDVLDTYDEDIIISAMRHEIGHVLGFTHSPVPWHLMYYSIDSVFKDVELHEWEIEAFKVYY